MIALRFFALCGLFAFAPALSPSHANEQFYRGRTIAVVVPSGASGGYDSYARLLARHMGKHIPGKPHFVVQNMPGGAGVRAADYLSNVAAQDGTAIGMLEQALVSATGAGTAWAARRCTKVQLDWPAGEQ